MLLKSCDEERVKISEGGTTKNIQDEHHIHTAGQLTLLCLPDGISIDP
jgi:hypothetical protein